MERTGHLYLGPQHSPPSYHSVPPYVSQYPLPLPNSVEFPKHYSVGNFSWDFLPPYPWSKITGSGNIEPNFPIPSTSSSTSFGHYTKTPHTTKNPPKFVEQPNELDPIVDNIPFLPSVPPLGQPKEEKYEVPINALKEEVIEVAASSSMFIGICLPFKHFISKLFGKIS